MIIKVTRVAHLNVATAFAILSSTGPVNVTLGALTASLPFVLVAIQNVALFVPRSKSRVGRATTITVSLLIIVISAFVTPMLTTAYLVASLIWSTFLAFLFRDGGPTRKRLQDKVRPRFEAVETKLGEVNSLIKELEDATQNTPSIPADEDKPLQDRLVTANANIAISEERLATLEKVDDRLADVNETLATSMKGVRETEHSIMFWSATGFLVPLLLLTLTSSTVWLPPEHFAMTDGTSIVGYSLRSDGEWHAVLVDTPRGVAQLRSKTIAKREICRVDEASSIRPLADYITGRDATSPYASCDALKEDSD
jgi:hypothetical protein